VSIGANIKTVGLSEGRLKLVAGHAGPVKRILKTIVDAIAYRCFGFGPITVKMAGGPLNRKRKSVIKTNIGGLSSSRKR
jgi:hypothetical protein